MSSHNLTMNNSRTGTDFHSSATTHSVPSLVHSIGPAPSVPPSTHSPQDAVTVDQLESSDMHNTACIESGNAGEGMVAMRPSSSIRLREFVEEQLDELERFSFPLELDPKEDATGRLAYLKKCKEFDFFMFPISSVVCHFHLETINLDHAGLGDKGAIALAEALYVNQCVATLIVSNNFITPKGGEHLLFAVRENRTIRHLDVSHNRLGYRAAHLGILPVGTLVRHILLHNERIVELLLADNKIGDKDMAEIAEGLIENFTLQRIDLRENELSPKGGEHAALVLKRNSELKSMNLSWNALRSNGSLLFLRDGLAETNVLKVIHLSWNGLNDDGGIVLGQVIRDNASLEDIDVSHNRIGINGAQSLAEGMKVNTTLKRLWLNNNPLRDVGCAEILRTIPDNGSIVFLDVRFTDSGFETVQSMQSINEMQEGKRNKVEILFGDIPAH